MAAHVSDSVFRSIRLSLPENSGLIAFNNAFVYMRFFGDVAMGLDEKVAKKLTKQHFGKEMDPGIIQNSIAQLYHVTRSDLLFRPDINVTDKEKKFLGLYKKFSTSVFEMHHRSIAKTITPQFLEEHYSICLRMEAIITPDGNIVQDLIQTHDESGSMIYESYKQYFSIHVENGKNMWNIYQEAKIKQEAEREDPTLPINEPSAAAEKGEEVSGEETDSKSI